MVMLNIIRGRLNLGGLNDLTGIQWTTAYT